MFVGCNENIVTSDHKPVFASFDVGILGQFVPEKGTAAQPGDKAIIFDDVTAQVSKCMACHRPQIGSICQDHQESLGKWGLRVRFELFSSNFHRISE